MKFTITNLRCYKYKWFIPQQYDFNNIPSGPKPLWLSDFTFIYAI